MSNSNIRIDKKKVLFELGFVPIPGYMGYWARVDGKIGSSNNREVGSVKILSPLVINSGYETVTLVKAGVYNERRTVHRLVASTFLSNPDSLPEVNHKNGSKLDNRVDNLEWVSTSGNRRHAIDTGLQVSLKGVQVNTCKLSESDVIEISQLYKNGVSSDKIADKYNISSKQVNTIGLGSQWKHLGIESIRRGKSKGESHSKSVLNELQVIEIRKLSQSGLTHPEISKIYDCSVSCVSHVVNRHTWKHI